MSVTPEIDAAPLEHDARDWLVRGARVEDVTAIVGSVSQLLVELGGAAPPRESMEAAARALIANEQAGAVLVAEAGDALVGLLGASWQLAMHVPGRYLLIQDLWVEPRWRSRSIGKALLSALVELAREAGAPRIEVGLPREHFAKLEATQTFYARNGFAALGARMRAEL